MSWHGMSDNPHGPSGAGGASSSGSGTSTDEASSAAAGPGGLGGAQAGGSSMSGAGGGSGTPGTVGAEDHDEQAHAGHDSPPAEAAARHTPAPDLTDDPLAGLCSDRLRDNLSRDAFRSASSTAQDSAIVAEADRAARIAAMPDCLRDALAPFARVPDVPLPDHSPAARAERIEALGGEIPAWAKGDLQNDPKLLKMLEQPAFRGAKLEPALVTGQVRLRGPNEAPTQPAATVVARRAKQPPIQHPTRTPRAPSADREM